MPTYKLNDGYVLLLIYTQSYLFENELLHSCVHLFFINKEYCITINTCSMTYVTSIPAL